MHAYVAEEYFVISSVLSWGLTFTSVTLTVFMANLLHVLCIYVDMAGKPRYAILLDSRIGYKDMLSWWEETKTLITGKEYDKVRVIPGSLLESIPDSEVVELAKNFDPVLNFKVISSDMNANAVRLHCGSHDENVKELTFTQMLYLQAVKTMADRIAALPKLKWIESLHDGSGALLNMPTAFPQPIKVAVRYVGKVPVKGEEGIQFGVELIVSD